MHAEVGRALLDAHKAFIEISHIIQADGARAIESDGKIVATYGLRRNAWWFSQDEAFWSAWFYVTPEHRDGPATRLLLEDIADRVEDEGIPAYIHICEGQKPSRSPVAGSARKLGSRLAVG